MVAALRINFLPPLQIDAQAQVLRIPRDGGDCNVYFGLISNPTRIPVESAEPD